MTSTDSHPEDLTEHIYIFNHNSSNHNHNHIPSAVYSPPSIRQRKNMQTNKPIIVWFMELPDYSGSPLTVRLVSFFFLHLRMKKNIERKWMFVKPERMQMCFLLMCIKWRRRALLCKPNQNIPQKDVPDRRDVMLTGCLKKKQTDENSFT